MTRIALIRRHDVVGRLSGRADLGADAMTRGAGLRRALENRVDVTGLARQVAVLPEELKACGQMIELRANGRLRRCSRRAHTEEE
jgi:hypothetical protein